MKKSLFRGKSTHTKIYTAITVVGVLLLLLLNILFTHLGARRMLFVDLTPEGLYQLSDVMEEVCDEVMALPEGKEIRITFCADPDTLVDTFATRVPYYMALAMDIRYDNLTVETHNITYNPTAVAAYKTTSRTQIRPTDMIISYGNKYRIVNCYSLWTTSNDTFYSFNGEYKLASALASLTAITLPRAYFLTDHGESYYDPADPDSEMSVTNAAFADLLADVGMEIRTAKLSEWDKVPEDCAMLIINLPTLDFTPDDDKFNTLGYVSDLEKLDRYLVDGGGTLLVNKAYDVSLPYFETFLADWGIAYSNSYVIDSENAIGEGDGTSFIAQYDSSEESYGYNFYEDFVTLASAPRMVFSDTGYLYCSYGDGESRSEPGYQNVNRRFATFIGTHATATANTAPGVVESEAGYKALAAISARTSMDSYSGETTYSYIFAAASPDFFSNDILGNPSYANYELTLAVLRNVSRTDRYVSTDLGGLSRNSSSFGGKLLVNTILSTDNTTVYRGDKSTVYKGLTAGARTASTVVVMIPAALALVMGAVIFIKRKFL